MADGIVSSPVQALVPEPEPVLGARRAILIFVVFFLVQLLVGVTFGVAAGVYAVLTRGTEDSSVITEVITPLLIPVSILGLLVASAIAFWMTRRTLRGSIARGALAPVGWCPAESSAIVRAAVTGVLVSLVYLFVLVPASPPPEGQEWGPLVTAAQAGGWPRIFWAFLALALAPPIEEFVFRGVLLSGLSKALGLRASAVIVTVIFVFAHVTETLAYWPAWIAIGALAIAAAFFRIRTGSLLPAVAAHAGYNLVMVVAAFLGLV